jgi:polysaccharide export outer membrane protein
VDFRGMIQVPLVGEIRAEGLTPTTLGDYLTERYQLLDPSITEVLVSIVEYKSQTVTVVGEVRNAGPQGFVEIPDLWDVILTAGGPAPEADLSRIQIIRGQPLPGEPAAIHVDLSAGIEAIPHGSLPRLRASDKVFVPSLEDVPVGSQDFQVIGAVGSPGTYRISVATNVIEAISASGGPTSEADLSNVHLTRTVGQETVSWKVNLQDYLFAAQTSQNLELLAGDTITVGQRSGFWTTFRTVVGVVIPLLSLAVTAMWATR